MVKKFIKKCNSQYDFGKVFSEIYDELGYEIPGPGSYDGAVECGGLLGWYRDPEAKIPCWGHAKYTFPEYETTKLFKIGLKSRRSFNWFVDKRTGQEKVFETKDQAENFRLNIVSKFWKGDSYVEEFDPYHLIKDGFVSYEIDEAMIDLCKKVEEQTGKTLRSEWNPPEVIEILINENPKLTVEKDIYRLNSLIKRYWDDKKEKEEREIRKRKFEEDYKNPLYQIFLFVTGGEYYPYKEGEKIFDKYHPKWWVDFLAECEREREAYNKTFPGHPEDHEEYFIFGDKGWWDE